MNKRSSGFSLIELMVVLLIISISLSLVGPSVAKVYSQHMALQETRLLKQMVTDVSVFAFTQHHPIGINLSGNQFTASMVTDSSAPVHDTPKGYGGAPRPVDEEHSETAIVLEHRFAYLQFSEQEVIATQDGLLSVDALIARATNGEQKRVEIHGVRMPRYWTEP